MHRVHARRAARTAATTSFLFAPEPRTIGVIARGQQLIVGNFLFSGLLVKAPNRSIWDIAPDNETVEDEIQGCAWLDDLAALGDERARERAQSWVFEWINRYGDGRGSGWTPDLVGRRLIRWINHSQFLLHRQEQTAADRLLQSLAQQTLFLSRRWKTTAPGLRRFEALSGMIYAGLSLDGMEHHVDRAVSALAHDCDTQIDAEGAIATRNPEELLEILSLLHWTIQSLADAGHKLPPQLIGAVERITPTLRAIRHADGGLARFHGGGRGIEGRLDAALAASGVKTLPEPRLYMGYARLAGGRTSVIADAAAPPSGQASADAHASTLAFELTSGRRPVIVNCGSGARFGDAWRRASRATPSHSTMMIEGVSSSHLAAKDRLTGSSELLTDLPTRVQGRVVDGETGRKLELSHNGYQPTHGLTHARILQLSVDGRALEGEDLLTTLDPTDEAICDKALAIAGIPYVLRFHLHPDVDASLDHSATTVRLTLKSGEVWRFRHDGTAKLSLAPSIYLQNGRLKPLAAQQVVLSGHAIAYATRVRWLLAKAQDTPNAVRDLVQTDPLDAVD
ncbi:MAG: heparinase II/III family protein [Yoonia sp.]|uniref:heparinase II/III family protein n=1 Tax=Yoonia sp. TaxID=2212373 RepID=UPI00273EC9CE|nr:heparinase II/III family protein [Yoonia sp.]MDP5086402.1 heparinase II/III family protein [Yoonia sp.]